MTTSARSVYFVLLSAIAGMILVMAFLLGQDKDADIDFADKAVVGVVFIACCFLGMSMAVYPNWSRRCLGQSSSHRKEADPGGNPRGYRGHHPDCDGFENHRISVSGHDYCAGCLGIMIGAVVSIVLMTAYLLSHAPLASSMQIALFVLGFGAVAVAYVETVIVKRNSVVHVAVNALMITGMSLMVVGITEATGHVSLGLLVVAFSFLCTDTRIQLSSWRHALICRKCPESCKMY